MANKINYVFCQTNRPTAVRFHNDELSIAYKWLIRDTKHHKGDQLQNFELPSKIS